MKKISTIYLLIICTFLLTNKSFGIVHTISVGVSGLNFASQTVAAVVGDTIRWNLVSGSHTTTCDGSSNTVLPPGAPAWNSPINSSNTMFEYVLVMAGNYQYKCIPHASAGMIGFLNVSQGTGVPVVTPVVNHLDVSVSSVITEIKFYNPSESKVTLCIYDLTGKKVQTIVDEMLGKGEYSFQWDNAFAAPQGTYLVRLESREYISTRKFVIRR